PDAKAEDRTTARDIARLARALSSFGKVLEWTSLSGLPFDDGATLLRNRNPLIGSVPGVDGLHVARSSADGRMDSGSTVITALRDGMRLIAVIADVPDRATQLSSAADLLEWGFANFERLEVVQQGEKLNLSVDVDGGAQEQVTPLAGATFAVVRHRGEERSFQVRYQLPSTVVAPIEKQQQIGEIIVEEHNAVLAVIPALSPLPVPAVGVLSAGLR
ncbi:MAG: D-alanyl-D-alanine carboxypeptidase, partial [Deltaproteobacteria bacterium]|nr:D-alanyl-D-alanine carboxypeptidase [Deltaproteobacteria bacterium]